MPRQDGRRSDGLRPVTIARQFIPHAEGSVLVTLGATPPGRPAGGPARPAGRTQEIQRLIGRSLRAAVDLQKLGERSILIDCDVIQADGGTRTAAITGAFVALVDALHLPP